MIFSSCDSEAGFFYEGNAFLPGQGRAGKDDMCLWRVERDSGCLDGRRGLKRTGQGTDAAIAFQAREGQDEGFTHKISRFMARGR